jgi:hypothetical protein
VSSTLTRTLRLHFRPPGRRPRTVIALAALGTVAALASTVTRAQGLGWDTLGWLAFFAAVVSAVGYVHLLSDRSDDERTITARAWWKGSLHLACTTCLGFWAGTLTWVHLYAGAAASSFGDALKDGLLVATVVGGVLALFRSTGTRQEVKAIFQEVQIVRRRLEQRTAQLTDDLLGIFRSADLLEAQAALRQMTRTAINLPDTHRSLNALSVWTLEKGRWKILVADGISQATIESFELPALADDEEPERKGVVPCLGGGRLADPFIASGDTMRRFWAVNEHGTRDERTVAATLLRSRAGAPIGAICLTSEVELDVSVGTRERQELENVLRIWAPVFTLGIEIHANERRRAKELLDAATQEST